MKIKQYIVTYNNNEMLNRCLKSMSGVNHEITIIDNFGNCEIQDYDLNVKIIKNELRPQFSTGHLSKDWNAGLVNGFQNLNHPECDIVILNQNDTVFKHGYINKLIELHNRFDFIQMGSGDEMMSFTPNAIKQVGLFDERFCNIGFQEADYFLRCLLYNKEKSTINDIDHLRILNKLDENEIVIENVTCGHNRQEESTELSAKFHPNSHLMFNFKWSNLPLDRNWNKLPLNLDLSKIQPNLSNIMYPYFEKDIITLKEQNFLHHFN
jgi:Zn ribbon nucleic-acid-binding protein